MHTRPTDDPNSAVLTPESPAHEPNTYWSFASRPSSLWALVVVTALARIIYLAFLCPYTLAEDEAFYWEWSRHLDLSYYSKGPGIAWLIRASTALFGTTEFAIRFPAVVSGAVLSTAVGLWARDAASDDGFEPLRARRIGFFAACCTLLLPMFQASALLMTIDGPYAACWAVACWLGHRAIVRGQPWMWSAAALAVGIGVLFKYTALILPLSWLIAFAASRSLRRRTPFRPLPILSAIVVFAACLLPIAIWNAREGWPTIAHLLGHLGMKGGDVIASPTADPWRYRPQWTLFYIVGQFALAGPVFALALVGALRARHTLTRSGVVRVSCFLTLLVFYFVVSFITEPEGNWAFAAHVAGCVLAAGVIESGMSTWKARVLAWRRLAKPRPREGFLFARPASVVQILWHSSLIMGVIAAVGIVVLPVIDTAWKAITGAARSPIPVGRFTNADRMGDHAAALAWELERTTGQRPFYCALHYGRAAQLAFYVPGRPTVVCASSMIAGGRQTQYDWWPETRPDHPSLRGRPAVVVGGTRSDWMPWFRSVGDPVTLNGDGKRGRPAFQAIDFYPPD